MFNHWVNIEIAIIDNPIIYTLNKVTFCFLLEENSEEPENK